MKFKISALSRRYFEGRERRNVEGGGIKKILSQRRPQCNEMEQAIIDRRPASLVFGAVCRSPHVITH
jgi:hypothetical protein